MSSYKLVTYWSDIDSCYLTEVPELPGCMSDGLTIEESEENIEEIISDYQTMEKYMQTLEEPTDDFDILNDSLWMFHSRGLLDTKNPSLQLHTNIVENSFIFNLLFPRSVETQKIQFLEGF